MKEVDDELRKAGKSDAEIARIGPHKEFKVREMLKNTKKNFDLPPTLLSFEITYS